MRPVLLIAAMLLVSSPLRAQDAPPDADGPEAAVEVDEGAPRSASPPADAADEAGDAPDAEDEVNPFLEEQRDREAEAEAAAEAERALEDELPPGLDPELFGRDDEEDDDAGPEAPRQPLRVLASLGAGLAVRLRVEEEFSQETLAPGYLELRGGVIFPSRSLRIRHGASLGVTLNTDDDGSFFNGVGGGEQLVLAPGYLLRVQFTDDPVPDLVLYGHAAVAVAIDAGQSHVSPGFEIGADVAYMFLAGLGAYAGVTAATYVGAQDRSGSASVHPMLAFELGLIYDFEVLP
ncbi:MAG: hypothetical protein AAF447_20680 [Myxococcota bacterium]